MVGTMENNREHNRGILFRLPSEYCQISECLLGHRPVFPLTCKHCAPVPVCVSPVEQQPPNWQSSQSIILYI